MGPARLRLNDRPTGVDAKHRTIARVALGACLLLAACTPARREVQTDIVRRIRLEGNGAPFSGHNDLQLRSAMQQRQSPALTLTFPFMYFTQPVTLDRNTLAADSRRIEVWYAHHGWFDARFDGWEVRRVRAAGPKRAGVIDVIGHVDLDGAGPRDRKEPAATLRTVQVNVLDEDNPAAATIARAALAGEAVSKGDAFSLDAAQRAAAAIKAELQNNSYAYATVNPRLDACRAPDDTPCEDGAWAAGEPWVVDLVFDVAPGPHAEFGPIQIEGLNKVEQTIVTDSLDLETGQSFSLEALRKTQQRLFDTSLFSLVDVVPDTTDPSQPSVVPVQISLKETKFNRVRLGAGFQFDYFVLSPRLQAEYRALRFAGSPLQAELAGSFGANVGIVNEDDDATPFFLTGSGDLRFNYPWLLRRKLTLTAGVSGRRDLQFGSLPYWTLGADFGLRYAFTDEIAFTAGPRFEYFEYFSLTNEQASAASLQFGTDFGATVYRLLSFDMGLRIDYRDSLVAPRRGTYWGLDVRQSIPIPTFRGGDFQSGFLYTRLDGEVRAWVPLRFSKEQRKLPLVLAGRLHGRWLIPWRGLDDALPYPDLAFLGGPNSLRGFRTNQVGAYDSVCSYEGGRPRPPHNNGENYTVDRTYLPKGGALALEAMGELRYDVGGGLSIALFSDVGLLNRRLGDFNQPAAGVAADMLRYDGGVGLRYATPVGPLRIDLGIRPLFTEDRQGPSGYYNCNAIDRLPRAFDLMSSSRNAREALLNPASLNRSVGINLFIAIGEAF